MRRSARLLLLALMVAAGSGCVAGRSSSPFVRSSGKPFELLDAPMPKAKAAALVDAARNAGPPRAAAASTGGIEDRDPVLREALAALHAGQTAGRHIVTALAYVRHGVADQAMDHFDQALRLDDRSAAAYDGRARIWRDWGFAGLALADASRARYFAPESPAVRNTLGTILLALGECDAARQEFRAAQQLAPEATYAAQNLRRVNSLISQPGQCRGRAVRQDVGGRSMPAPKR